jgi:hypothetical protein
VTITYHRGRIVELTLDDTVGILLPPSAEQTQRLGTPHRRPYADPTKFEDRRSFAGTDSVTGEVPLLGVDEADPEQAAFDRFYAATGDPDYVGRHHQRGWFARLLRRIGGAK